MTPMAPRNATPRMFMMNLLAVANGMEILYGPGNSGRNPQTTSRLKGGGRLKAWPHLHEVVFDFVEDAFFGRLVFGGQQFAELFEQPALIARELRWNPYVEVDVKIA